MNKILPTLLFLFIATTALPQSLMTREQVYNYDAGDIFISKEGGIYFPPTYRTTTILSKTYSPLADTIYYTADIYKYIPAGCPTCSAVYDTILNAPSYITNLTDTVGGGLGIELTYLSPDCVDTTGYTGSWVDSVYYDTTFCSKLTTLLFRMENGPFLIDTCFNYFEPFYGYDIYGEGIGLKKHYFNTCADGNFYCQEIYELLFYRKGPDSCGARPFIPLPIGMNEIYAPDEITISPNPFSTETLIMLPAEMKNTNVIITDIAGKEILNFAFSGRELVVQKNNLTKGMYFISFSNNSFISIRRIVVQ